MGHEYLIGTCLMASKKKKKKFLTHILVWNKMKLSFILEWLFLKYDSKCRKPIVLNSAQKRSNSSGLGNSQPSQSEPN